MRLLARLCLSVLLLGGSAVAAAVWLPDVRPWLPTLCVVVMVWRLARDFFLGQFRLEVGEESFCLVMPGRPLRTIAYSDLRRVEILYPQLPPLDWLFRRRHGGVAVGDSYTAPAGYRRSSMLRRLWTWSPDFL